MIIFQISDSFFIMTSNSSSFHDFSFIRTTLILRLPLHYLLFGPWISKLLYSRPLYLCYWIDNYKGSRRKTGWIGENDYQIQHSFRSDEGWAQWAEQVCYFSIWMDVDRYFEPFFFVWCLSWQYFKTVVLFNYSIGYWMIVNKDWLSQMKRQKNCEWKLVKQHNVQTKSVFLLLLLFIPTFSEYHSEHHDFDRNWIHLCFTISIL